jgi:hypothetical protein
MVDLLVEPNSIASIDGARLSAQADSRTRFNGHRCGEIDPVLARGDESS